MFTSALTLRALTPDLWALVEPLVWAEPGLTITIPKGFITDLASVPHVIDSIPFLDRTGKSRRAGAFHDGLYALGRGQGKDWCDNMLATALRADGLSPRQAQIYYWAVHYFGKSSWESDAREGIYGGIVSGDFETKDAYAAWIAGGASIFSHSNLP